MPTIYPTGTAYIGGVEAIEQEVSAARAKELLAYRPAAFTTDPKQAATSDTVLYLTHSPDIPPDSPPPDEPATSPEAPQKAGPSDSTPEV